MAGKLRGSGGKLRESGGEGTGTRWESSGELWERGGEAVGTCWEVLGTWLGSGGKRWPHRAPQRTPRLRGYARTPPSKCAPRWRRPRQRSKWSLRPRRPWPTRRWLRCSRSKRGLERQPSSRTIALHRHRLDESAAFRQGISRYSAGNSGNQARVHFECITMCRLHARSRGAFRYFYA